MDIINVIDIVSLVSTICHYNIARLIIGLYLIRKARAALKEKRRRKMNRGLLFHRDNAPAHMSSQALAAIRNVGFELLPHPPYSQDLAPSDFCLFPKLKEFMTGCKFADDEDVICSGGSTWGTGPPNLAQAPPNFWTQ